LNDIGAAIPGCAKTTKPTEHAATTISRREYENAMVRLLGRPSRMLPSLEF
jgi:hypothetical protein